MMEEVTREPCHGGRTGHGNKEALTSAVKDHSTRIALLLDRRLETASKSWGKTDGRMDEWREEMRHQLKTEVAMQVQALGTEVTEHLQRPVPLGPRRTYWPLTSALSALQRPSMEGLSTWMDDPERRPPVGIVPGSFDFPIPPAAQGNGSVVPMALKKKTLFQVMDHLLVLHSRDDYV